MTGPDFVDTDVLVYRADASDPAKHARADASYRRVLLTEDLQDGPVFDAVRVVSPFALPNRTPSEVLEGLER